MLRQPDCLLAGPQDVESTRAVMRPLAMAPLL